MPAALPAFAPPFALLDFPQAHGLERLRLAFGQPLCILQADTLPQVATVIQAAEAAALQGHWVIGGVSYDAAPAFDGAMRIPSAAAWPLAWFAVCDTAHAWPASLPPAQPLPPLQWQTSCDATRFARDIDSIRSAIRQGEVYQINHSLRLHATLTTPPDSSLAWFLHLRKAQPDGYALWLDMGQDARGLPRELLSLSPELFFRRQHQRLTTQPMKGTVRRGRWAAEDQALMHWLQDSAKNRAENLMIVDLLRNDLARLALPHSIQVEELFALQRHPSVWQMTSTISAECRPQTGLLDIFRALFPCGSITGAPKIQAMTRISALENEARGYYCGALGLIQPGGEAIFNVAIRTLSRHGSELTLGVGAGITWDSDSQEEHAETLLKARFVQSADTLLQTQTQAFSLFETLRLENGHYWLLDGHLQRLQASAAYFGFSYPAAAVTQQLEQTRQQHAQGQWRVRLDIWPDGQSEIQASPLPANPTDPSVMLAAQPLDSRQSWLYHKTSQRQYFDATWQAAQASHPDLFDVLLHNERGELTEFTRGNLLLEIDGQRYTPPQESGLLDGVLRRHLINTGQLRERRLTFTDLQQAQRMVFINSLRGEIQVRLSSCATTWPDSSCDKAVTTTLPAANIASLGHPQQTGA